LGGTTEIRARTKSDAGGKAETGAGTESNAGGKAEIRATAVECGDQNLRRSLLISACEWVNIP
jgi:hypothetical protein